MTTARAVLHDGETAIPHPVEAQLLPDALRIIRVDGATQDWPVAALREVDRMPWEMRIARTGAPQRLVVGDPAMMAALDMTLKPVLSDEAARRWRWVINAVLIAPLFGAMLWFGWPPLADALARSVPAAWEERLGDTVAASLNQGLRRCTAPEGVAALDRLSARLVETAGLPQTPVVQVVDSGMVNAFAAPGRQVIIHRGLIDGARSGRGSRRRPRP